VVRIPGQLALIYAGVLAAGLADGLSRVALAKYLRDDLGASILAVSSLTTWYMAARAGAETVDYSRFVSWCVFLCLR
jgi:predicted membrane-bound spermidine synthase